MRGKNKTEVHENVIELDQSRPLPFFDALIVLRYFCALQLLILINALWQKM